MPFQAGPVMKLTILVMLLLACCISCSQERPLSVETDSWTAYVATAGGRVYELDADSLFVTDSFQIGSPPHSTVVRLLISPETQSLYVQAHEYPLIRNRLYRIGIATHEVAATFDGRIDGLVLADNGQVLLVNTRDAASQKTVCLLMNPLTLQIEDSLPTGMRAFHARPESRVVPVQLEEESTIRLLEVSSFALSGAYRIPMFGIDPPHSDLVSDVILLSDDSTILIARNLAFEIGNVVTGETLMREAHFRQFGEISVSSDGLMAVAGYPSIWWMGVMDEMSFYDLREFKRTGSIISSNPDLFASGRIVFLPDNRRALTCGDPNSSSVGKLRVIDVLSMSPIQWKLDSVFDDATAMTVARLR